MPKYIGQQVALPESKLYHPHVFTPSKYDKYEVRVVMDQKEYKKEWDEVEDAIVSIASQAFGLSKTEAKKQIKDGKLTTPIGPHKAKDPSNTDAPAKETGEIVFTARQEASKGAPMVVDQYTDPIPEDRASEIYYGIFGVVVVFLMAYNSGSNRGVTARINVLQKLRDAEGGGGRTQALSLLKKMAKPRVEAKPVTAKEDKVLDDALNELLGEETE